MGASDYATLFVVCCPAGLYFHRGAKMLSLMTLGAHVRAWPGGTGGHKISANYAATFLPQQVAAQRGYDQVLWLLGDRITEAGAMNFFVVRKRSDGGKISFVLWTAFACSQSAKPYRFRLDYCAVGWNSITRCHPRLRSFSRWCSRAWDYSSQSTAFAQDPCPGTYVHDKRPFAMGRRWHLDRSLLRRHSSGHCFHRKDWFGG